MSGFHKKWLFNLGTILLYIYSFWVYYNFSYSNRVTINTKGVFKIALSEH
nr:MAG TPA: hypothetical protein [Caudoviricetes sp.]